MCAFKKGNIPWIKGKHHSAEARRKISKGHRGKPLSKEHRRKISEGNKNKYFSEEYRRKISTSLKGHLISEETKRKISEAQKGKHHSAETKAKMREARLKRVFPAKDTFIEVLMQKELRRQDINFEKHIPLLGKYQADIKIGDLIVECDGDYWHSLPDRVKSDCRRNRELKEAGYKILRFWGHEIRSDVETCVGKIRKVLNVC